MEKKEENKHDDLQKAEFAYKNILVTGASGSLGSQLLYALTSSGLTPTAHVRRESNTAYIDSLKIEKREADLRNRPELADLACGMDAVIHTAAWVDFRQNRLTQFTGINTIGAVEMYRAARKNGVKRFVHVSTIAAIGAVPTVGKVDPTDRFNKADETHEYNLDHLKIPYFMSKRAAEIELRKEAAEGGPELVIVNPSIIMAPSPTGDHFARTRRRLSYFFAPDYPNIVNLVDIRDVAQGTICALSKGRPGERYILSGDNITIRDLVLALSVQLKKMPHLVRVPLPMVRSASRLSLWFGKAFNRGNIGFYPDLVNLADYDWAYSWQKARRELGYHPRSIHATFNDLQRNSFAGSYVHP